MSKQGVEDEDNKLKKNRNKNNHNKMEILEPKRSRTFQTSFYPSLLRTGVIADGSCFYHALCHSLFQEYRELSDMDKRGYVQAIRRKLIEELTLDQFKALGQGESYRMQMVLHLRSIIQKMNKFDFEFWDNKVLSKVSTEWKDTNLQTLTRIIGSLVSENIGSILEMTEKITLRYFKKHVQMEWVDELGMELISNYFKCNFYFFEAHTRLPYHTYIVNPEHRRNIVILWVGESHYESIGQLLQETKVKRVFTNRDKLILTIRQYLKL